MPLNVTRDADPKIIEQELNTWSKEKIIQETLECLHLLNKQQALLNEVSKRWLRTIGGGS